MVIYKYYINEKYNASALNIPMFWLTTSPCSYAEHPDVVTEIIRMFWMWEI